VQEERETAREDDLCLREGVSLMSLRPIVDVGRAMESTSDASRLTAADLDSSRARVLFRGRIVKRVARRGAWFHTLGLGTGGSP
jgi:hypothetical protein